MLSGLVLLLPLLLCSLSLGPALALGRSAPEKDRFVSGVILAIILNCLTAVLLPISGFMSVLLMPTAGFRIAASVAGMIGRRAWLMGISRAARNT